MLNSHPSITRNYDSCGANGACDLIGRFNWLKLMSLIIQGYADFVSCNSSLACDVVAGWRGGIAKRGRGDSLRGGDEGRPIKGGAGG